MRATVSGIWGNAKEEAIYPIYMIDSARQHLDGKNNYTLRFAPGKLPPVNAFWSMTMLVSMFKDRVCRAELTQHPMNHGRRRRT